MTEVCRTESCHRLVLLTLKNVTNIVFSGTTESKKKKKKSRGILGTVYTWEWRVRRGMRAGLQEWVIFQKESCNDSHKQKPDCLQLAETEQSRLLPRLQFKALQFCFSFQMMALLIAFVSLLLCGIVLQHVS